MVKAVKTSLPAKSRPVARKAKSKPPLATQANAPQEPSRSEIAERAYYLYLERVGKYGGEVDDWLRAERELREASHPVQTSARDVRTM
jgi:hypothetical protein